MADESKAVAAYDYDYNYRFGVRLSKILTIIALLLVFVSLAISVILVFAVSVWFIIAVTVSVFFLRIIFKRVTAYGKALIIAGRYLILGDKIVYYRSIRKARIDRRQETLTLTSDGGDDIVIEAAHFPTNARKPDKVRRNKSTKFNKVAEKVIKHLKETVPDSIIVA